MEFMFGEKETKLLIIIIFNQSYFKVGGSRTIKLRRKMSVIKRKPIRFTLIKYLFQKRTNLVCGVVARESIRYQPFKFNRSSLLLAFILLCTEDHPTLQLYYYLLYKLYVLRIVY